MKWGQGADSATVRYFVQRTRDEIQFTYVPFGNSNVDPTRRRGVEAEVHAQVLPRVNLTASVQQLTARYTAGENAGKSLDDIRIGGRGNKDRDQQVFAGCDFVIEAIFEELSLKQELFKKLEKIVDKEGHRMWNCHFCGVERSEWNHTKAWHHAIGGKDVASCKRIPPRWKIVFV